MDAKYDKHMMISRCWHLPVPRESWTFGQLVRCRAWCIGRDIPRAPV